jgi:hypothetical protein
MDQLLQQAQATAAAGQRAPKKRSGQARDETDDSDSDQMQPTRLGFAAHGGKPADSSDDDEEGDDDDGDAGGAAKKTKEAAAAFESPFDFDTMINVAMQLKKKKNLAEESVSEAEYLSAKAKIAADLETVRGLLSTKVPAEVLQQIFNLSVLNLKTGGGVCIRQNEAATTDKCMFEPSQPGELSVSVKSVNNGSFKVTIAKKHRFTVLALLQLASFRDARCAIYWNFKKAEKIYNLYSQNKSFVIGSLINNN